MTQFISFAIVATVLAGCSSSGGMGSLFGGETNEATAGISAGGEAPVSRDPFALPTQIGWTVARAQRCGFHFDPVKIKTDYLAYEAETTTTPQKLRDIERAFDYSRSSVAKKISENENYCNETVLAELREDMPKIVAGDYQLPDRAAERRKQRTAQGGILDFLDSGDSSEQKFDREKTLAPADSK